MKFPACLFELKVPKNLAVNECVPAKKGEFVEINFCMYFSCVLLCVCVNEHKSRSELVENHGRNEMDMPLSE